MKSGNYEAAIQKSVHKLKSKKQNSVEAAVLEESFQKANDRNRDRILFLKKEGNPDNWDEIFAVYSLLKNRQELVKPLLPLQIKKQHRDAQFTIVNYDDEIIQAKKNAAEYFYVHAFSLLDKNSKSEARTAYAELMRVKELYSNYKETDKGLLRAKDLGTSYALFKMRNTSGITLPPAFEAELTKISLTDLETLWVKYHTHEIKNLNYDYTILVNMKNIDVSPESVKENNFTETKVVPDGFQYVLDARGNVKKDSLGNDLKTAKTKTISCNVTETCQSKKAVISGTLDYINNASGQLLKTDPIAGENFFEYRTFAANGDLSALKEETKEKLGRRQKTFPSGFDMLLQAGQSLKGIAKNIIAANRNVLY